MLNRNGLPCSRSPSESQAHALPPNKVTETLVLLLRPLSTGVSMTKPLFPGLFFFSSLILLLLFFWLIVSFYAHMACNTLRVVTRNAPILDYKN